MTVLEMFIGLVLGLFVNEVTDVSPWLARRIVRWSARVQYAQTSLVEIREEELQALVNERPGNLFKLGTSMRFAAAAAAVYVRRRLWGEEAAEVGQGSSGLLEDMPSNLVARYLFPTERYRGEWKRHWVHPVKSWLVASLYAGLSIAAVVLRIQPRYHFWFITGIVILYLAWSILRGFNWYLTRFVISNKRLMSVEGVVWRRVGMIPLLRVTDMRYEQSPLGRMLNYGTFRLESANRRNVMRTIKDLPNPNELYLRIVEEMYEPAAVEARLGRSMGDNGTGGSSMDDNADLPQDLGFGWDLEFKPNTELRRHFAELSDQIGRLATAIDAMNLRAQAPPRDDTEQPEAPPLHE